MNNLIPLLALLLTPNFMFGQIYQWEGQAVGDRFGNSVSGAGDVNGDGIPDVIVGADYTGNNYGDAYVYSGANGYLLHQWSGQSYGRFGCSVAKAGDINLDGFDDVIIGASETSGGGSAYVYSGSNGSLLYQWDAQTGSDSFGNSVSGAGDVNGDGIPDVIVGAPFFMSSGTYNGAAYVYSGADGSLLYQWYAQNPAAQFGWSVSAAGDVDNDGFDDVIVGAPHDDTISWEAGSAYVYSGANGSLLYQWSGQNLSKNFGECVTEAGDFNSDGFADVTVGQPNSSSVYVYSGANGSLLDSFHGQAGDGFGVVISVSGDLNGDGFDDLIVGAPYADTNGVDSGSAYVYSGVNGSLLYSLYGQAGDRFGKAISASGDLNGDGFDDLIVGAPYADTNGVDSGSAYVYTGTYTNTSPIAIDDTVSTRYDLPITIDVLLNDYDADGDILTVVATQSPTNGTSNVVGNKVIYTPNAGWSGIESFLYFIQDAAGNTANATITIDVTRPVYTITNFIAGAYADFRITEAPTNSQVLIGYSLTGPGPTNTSFGPVDLSPPIKTLVALPVDINGEVVFSPLVPASAFGLTFYTQAKCGNMLSNSLALTVQ
jgi:hypothetical protein